MQIETPRVVIAAPASGSGKSTLSTGLMAALSRDYQVQGFKVGPDYIDPGYHTAATGRISRNLDTWMLSKPQVQAVFAHAAAGADIAIIEGVMGLFDGFDAVTETGSTAEAAKLLRAPVILVLDVSRMARSAGALALGFRAYDPDLQIAGVICNRVGSEQHARWVTEAVEAVGLPVFGCIARQDSLHIPERHLGLHTAGEREGEVARFLEQSAQVVANALDLARVWETARSAPPLAVEPPAVVSAPAVVRIAVARDAAFCFYYEDNLDLLRRAGAEIVPFSPLADETLPPGTAGIYLGGGYPELYGERLAANRWLREAVRAAIDVSMPTYAECGGLMYLTQAIIDPDGSSHAMVGVLPGTCRLQPRLSMGYRQVTAARDTLLLQKGESARGHEFHYSDWEDAPVVPNAYAVSTRLDDAARTEGFAAGALLVSYIHLHFAAHPAIASNFVAACTCWQTEKSGDR